MADMAAAAVGFGELLLVALLGAWHARSKNREVRILAKAVMLISTIGIVALVALLQSGVASG